MYNSEVSEKKKIKIFVIKQKMIFYKVTAFFLRWM